MEMCLTYTMHDIVAGDVRCSVRHGVAALFVDCKKLLVLAGILILTDQ